jgi:hypothetical protein
MHGAWLKHGGGIVHYREESQCSASSYLRVSSCIDEKYLLEGGPKASRRSIPSISQNLCGKIHCTSEMNLEVSIEGDKSNKHVSQCY